MAMATRLADEAAEMTEEGIKDIFDEDAEADAAVAAALVRQTSDRAMHAIRRVNELRAAGRALAFGHTADRGGNRHYIGRLTVIDDDEPLLIDWRAPAAVPFYQATPLKRMGVDRRRNFLYGDGTTGAREELVSYSDELFDLDAAADEIGLRGEAALLASVTAPTRDQMRSVVATIQAEQDAIIRAAGDEPLVVQGGPGTGKTVVALHRAAYLLYAQREALSDTGVLIIGPTSEFLTYIAGVLPSLGETGVLSVTVSELYPGVRRGAPEDETLAALKGRLDMAALLADGIADRKRRPRDPLNVWYGGRRVTLPVEVLRNIFDRAEQYPTHNEGADFFRFEVIEALTAEVFDPSFHNRDEARDHFRRSEAAGEFLLRHWPTLTPEQALNDLFGSTSLLRSAARSTKFEVEELDMLYRPRAPFSQVGDIHWSDADIPLLDELLALVGISLEGLDDEERIRERDELDEFELAETADREAADIAADDLDSPLPAVDPGSGDPGSGDPGFGD
ncbi:MAG: HelD family protein, partial [Acidimicrobiales bacterium]